MAEHDLKGKSCQELFDEFLDAKKSAQDAAKKAKDDVAREAEILEKALRSQR